MDIDLELYRVFCKVANHKNISRTAEEMFISQSAVTQSIQKLENMLGEKLYYRSKKGVELTEIGKNLYDYVKESVQLLDNTETIFSNFINLEKGVLRIGGGNTLISDLIIDPLTQFIEKHPGIEVSIRNGLTEDLVEDVSKGELDMVVFYLPYKSKKYLNFF